MRKRAKRKDTVAAVSDSQSLSDAFLTKNIIANLTLDCNRKKRAKTRIFQGVSDLNPDLVMDSNNSTKRSKGINKRQQEERCQNGRSKREKEAAGQQEKAGDGVHPV